MATLPEAKRGVCRVCGCTDERACPGGCEWLDDEHTWCSVCVAAKVREYIDSPEGKAAVAEMLGRVHTSLSQPSIVKRFLADDDD